MKRNLCATITFGLLFLGLSSQPTLAHDVSPVVQDAGQIVSVNKDYDSPILSLKGYDKVFIQELDLEHTQIVSPPWIEKENFHWKVTESNKAYLKSRFKQGVTQGLTENNGRYEIVEKQGKGVLVVKVEVISFMPYTTKEDEVSTSKGYGEFHISVRLRDGETRSLIHIFEGTQAIGDDYQPNTDMTRAKSSKELFNAWGQGLRKRLDAAN